VARKDAQQLDPGVNRSRHDADFDHHYLREPSLPAGPHSNALESPARQKLETANKKAARGGFLCESLNIQRFEYCLRFRALCKPTFFRSTSRASRVTRPALLRSGLSAGSYSIRARVRPWRTGPPPVRTLSSRNVHHDVELAQLVGHTSG